MANSAPSVQIHHVAGMIALGAVIFLLLVERGFRGFTLN